MEELGNLGQWKSWQLAALALENTAAHLLGERFDLERSASFYYDQDYARSVDEATLASFKFQTISIHHWKQKTEGEFQ